MSETLSARLRGNGDRKGKLSEPMGKIDDLLSTDFLTAANDPLLCDVEMPLCAVFYPQGFPVEITTNSEAVLLGAEESWGHFSKVFSTPPMEFRIGVMGEGDGDCPPPPTCRSWKNVLSNIADAENFAVCDLRRGLAFAWLTRSTVEDRAYFRYYFLEACTLCLMEKLYLTPLHAACVKLGESGVLLCGDSGAGKSSLAYACALRGWTFVADDATALIRARNDRTVVGNPHQMRFREAGIELFPELRRQRITPRATGDMAVELATSSMPEISTALMSPVDYVVFLNRREPHPPGLSPFPREIALPWFAQIVSFGDKEVREVQIRSLSTLLTVPVLELRYRDLDWAVNRLEVLVREGG